MGLPNFGAMLGVLKGVGDAALTAAPGATRVVASGMKGQMEADRAAEEMAKSRRDEERRDRDDELKMQYLRDEAARKRAEDAADNAARTSNQTTFERLRTEMPERYGGVDFDPDHDWGGELRKVAVARDLEQQLVVQGYSAADARLRAFHDIDRQAERRSADASTRAATRATTARSAISARSGTEETRGELGDRRSLAKTRIENMLAAGAPVDQVTTAMGVYKELAGAWTPDDVVAASRSTAAQRPDPQKDRRSAVRSTLGKTPVTALEQEIENALINGQSPSQILSEIESDPDMSPAERRRAKTLADRYIGAAKPRFER